MQRIPRNLRFFFLFSKSEVDRENVRVKFNDRTRVCVHKVHLAVDFTTTCWFLLTPPPSSGAHRRHLFFPSLSPLSKAREEDKERRRSLVTWFRFLFCKKENQAISVSNSFFVREIISFAKMIWSPTSKVSVFFLFNDGHLFSFSREIQQIKTSSISGVHVQPPAHFLCPLCFDLSVCSNVFQFGG